MEAKDNITIKIERFKETMNHNLQEVAQSKQLLMPDNQVDSDEEQMVSLSPFMKQCNSVRSITSSDSDDFERSESPGTFNIHNSPLVRSREILEKRKGKSTRYNPDLLQKLFDSKLKEIKPFLNKEIGKQDERIRYVLETLCKDFLDILIYEKPRDISMSYINLHNFDKALVEMIKSHKYKKMGKEIENIEGDLKKECMDLLCTINFEDLDKDSPISPTTHKNTDLNELSNFELKVAKTLRDEIIPSPIKRVNSSLLDNIKMALEKATKRIKQQDEQFRDMRYKYLKELQAYRDQLFKLENYPDNFEPMDVKYFTGLEILDEKTREILDKKVKTITEDYNFKLLRIHTHNMKLEDKIKKFELLCKGKNVAISINELNADDIVQKLSIVESDALPIWEGFVKHYGNGFFNKMIEKEFGINPDTHEEIGNKFGQEVNNIRLEMIEKFEKLSKESKEHIDQLKTKLRQKQTEMLALRENQEEEITKLRETMKKELELYFSEEKAADFKIYDAEKSDQYKIIKDLEDQLKDYQDGKSPRKIAEAKSKAKAEEFKNFLSQVKGDSPRKEKSKPSVEDQKESKEEQITKSKDWPLPNQDIIDDLREKNKEIEKEMLNYKYLATVGEKDLKRVKDKYKIAMNDISFLKDTNDKLRSETDSFDNILSSLQNANKENSGYVSALESDNESLKSQVKKLTSIMPPNRLALLDKQSPFAIINKQKQKAQFQMNANYLSTQRALLREATMGRGTQTDICGTDQELVGTVTQSVNIDVPVFEKEIQVEFGKLETTEAEVETDLKIEDISHKEDQIKKLNDENFKLEKEVSHLNDLASERESEFNASLKRIHTLERTKGEQVDNENNIALNECDKIDEDSETSISPTFNRTNDNLQDHKKDEEIVNKLDNIIQTSDRRKRMRKNVELNQPNTGQVMEKFDQLYTIWKKKFEATTSDMKDDEVDIKVPTTIPEEFNEVLQQALSQISFPLAPEQLNYSTISHLPNKQNYDLTESAHKNSYSPPGGPKIEWLPKPKKARKRVKTIVKRPVFNIFPFNLRWMDKIMTNAHEKSKLVQNVATQTPSGPEEFENLISSQDVSLNIENNDINPYNYERSSKTKTVQCSPTIKTRHIKKSKAEHNLSVNRSIDNPTTRGPSAIDGLRSKYNHKKSKSISKNSNMYPATYTKKSKLFSRRTKTLLQNQFEKGTYNEYQNQNSKKGQNPESSFRYTNSQLFDEENEEILSRNCDTSMSIRETSKGKGGRRSQVFMKNMHMSYYKSLNQTVANKKNRKPSIKHMAVGGKNIFKPRIMNDGSTGRENNVADAYPPKKSAEINMNLIISKKKKKNRRIIQNIDDNQPSARKYQQFTKEGDQEGGHTTDERPITALAESEFYTNTVQYPPAESDGRKSSIGMDNEEMTFVGKEGLFGDVSHKRSISQINHD
ncbi:unnamed protein product [Moneuplotes crassus]|uniref:Uncharacterized protein n=1 Tax=Euplotes crassus TaxID=5936 RepID=A0AAD1X6R9_EUPCR|nr:unnamed protein product [Moneuplotes crassus]